MTENEPPITLGLNSSPASGADSASVVRPEELQFDRAVPLSSATAPQTACAVCRSAIAGQYFQAQGQPVCPSCAKLIEAGQQAPPAISLLPSILYGAGAAFAGFVIYAFVAIAFDLQLALISILVGWMVGKAVRKGSKGLGGRPQQILAVVLTYFAITTSYIPVFIYEAVKSPKKQEQTKSQDATPAKGQAEKAPSLGASLAILVGLALAAPFLSLTSGVSGLLNIAIIFFGLRNAWKLTGRTDLMITGPYGGTA